MDTLVNLSRQVAQLDDVPDFALSPLPAEARLTREARRMLAAWQPLLERADFDRDIPGPRELRSRFAPTYKLLVCQMLTNLARTDLGQLSREATLAGADLPTFARQAVATILRAYPRLISPQLFPVSPLTGPDGRVFYEDLRYDTAQVVGGANIAVGDSTADTAKLKADYFRASEAAQSNRVKLSIVSQVVSALSYRLSGEWSFEAADDFAAVYNRDLSSALVEKMAHLLAWVTDRAMIDAAVAAVPSTSVITWVAEPSIGGTSWADVSPTEREAYQRSLWGDGILKVITAIRGRRFQSPNWAVAGPAAAEKLLRLANFSPLRAADGVIDLYQASIQDVGVLSPLNIRVLVDPQFQADSILFGSRPVTDFEPAIHFCPYRPISFSGEVESPGMGKRERGVYTRFAIAKPDVAVAASSQLGDGYGLLSIS